ncbi:MAG: hypothetical protein IK099_01445, partial [Clostridia bacterium]|nr:hypothetical protein [Clostridia bacterium]
MKGRDVPRLSLQNMTKLLQNGFFLPFSDDTAARAAQAVENTFRLSKNPWDASKGRSPSIFNPQGPKRPENGTVYRFQRRPGGSPRRSPGPEAPGKPALGLVFSVGR